MIELDRYSTSGSKGLSCIIILLLLGSSLLGVLASDTTGPQDAMNRVEDRSRERSISNYDGKNDKNPIGEKDILSSLERYNSDEKQYYIQVKGPTRSRWINTLEKKKIQIINYVGEFRYRLKMSPQMAEEIRDLDFVEEISRVSPLDKVQEGLSKGRVDVLLAGSDLDTLEKLRSKRELGHLQEITDQVVMNIKEKREIQNLAKNPEVVWIGEHSRPHIMDETSSEIVGGFWKRWRPYDGPGNYANQLGYNGSEVLVSICDTGIGNGTIGSAGHKDLTGRVIGGIDYTRMNNWKDGYGHGTHCAGLVAGNTYEGRKTTYANTSYYVGQGVAPEAKLYSQKIFSTSYYAYPDFDKLFKHAHENGTYVHSNSWGSSSFGRYVSYDRIYDEKVRDSNHEKPGDQPMVITASAGNSGGLGNQSTGSPGNAKNVITVGASLNFHPNATEYGNTRYSVSDPSRVASFSSRGPTSDGRIKPDVIAPGKGVLSLRSSTASNRFNGVYSEDSHYLWSSGTSMSNPITAGASAVIIDWYDETYGERPSPAMVKALLVNTARDLNNSMSIPNSREGWGRVNLPKVVSPETSFFKEDQKTYLETGERSVYNLKRKVADRPLNISLTWTDHASTEFNDVHLINDLNLKVYGPEGNTWHGNSFQQGHSIPNSPSQWDHDGDGSDDRNNVVNVFIPEDKVKEGMYSVVVEAENVAMDSLSSTDTVDQDFSLLARNAERYEEESPAINMIKPLNGSTHVTGDKTEISWIAGGKDKTTRVELEYSADNGSTWHTIEKNITGQAFLWNVPEEDSKGCRVRATITDSDGEKDISFSNIFEITPIYVEIDGPRAGEKLIGKCREKVKLDVRGIGPNKTIELWYRLDNSSDWISIGEGLAEPYVYGWVPPNVRSNRTYIKTQVENEMGQRSSWISGPLELLKRYSSPWTDGMEGTLKDWSHHPLKGGSSVDAWRVSSRRSKDGNASWWSGSPDLDLIPSGDSVLVTPPIHLDQKGESDRRRFSFEHTYSFGYNLQGPGDGSLIELWDNESKEWRVIEPMDGYDKRIQADSLNPLRQREGFTGTQEGWRRADFDLSAYTGKTVRIRFHVGWDSLYGREKVDGWFIDNVYIGEPPDYEVRTDIGKKVRIGRSGQKTTYDMTIWNTGLKDNTYELKGRGDWPINFSYKGEEIDSIPIDGGGEKGINVVLSVPPSIEEGSKRITNITVRSNSGKAKTVQLIETKIPYRGKFLEDFTSFKSKWEYNKEGRSYNVTELWNRSENRSFEGHSLHIGPEPATLFGRGSIIESPLVSLNKESEDYRLSFYHWYEFSYSYLGPMDGGNVKIWDNVTENWSSIEPTHGYEGEIAKGHGNPLVGQEVFSTRSRGWVQERFNISAYSGRTIKIRFHAGWDRHLQGTEGWYIDELNIARTPAYDLETYLSQERKMGIPGETVSYRFLVNNTGRKDEIYRISSGTDWPTDVYRGKSEEIVNSVHVQRGQSVSLQAVVHIPKKIEDGSHSRGKIKLISKSLSEVYAEVNFTTVTPFSRRFESDVDDRDGSWHHLRLSEGLVEDNWKRSRRRSDSFNLSWWSGREPKWLYQGGDSALETPYVSLEGEGSRAEIKFKHWYSFARNPAGYGDGGVIEIWDNVTGMWEKLSPKKGYPGNITPGYFNPLEGEKAYVGYSDGWTFSRFDISQYLGRTIKIRFHLGLDYYSFVRSEGWYIDDIAIGQPGDYQFSTEKGRKNKFGPPGTDLDYDIDIENTGLKTDTYSLKANCNWPTTLSTGEVDDVGSIELKSGESRNVTVEVGLPQSAEKGALERVELMIESQNQTYRLETIYLTAQVSASILLVDDDMGTEREDIYQIELDKNGFRYNQWAVYDHGEIDASTLDRFQIVIWLTGKSDGYIRPTLTEDERKTIQTYLEGGGRLYLSSMMAGLDRFLNDWNGWSTDVLGISINYLVNPLFLGKSMRVVGENKNPISHKLPLTLYGNNSHSDLEPNMTTVKLTNSSKPIYSLLIPGVYSENYCVGAKAKDNDSRVIYTGFEFGSVGKNRTELMERIVRWLKGYPNTPMNARPLGPTDYWKSVDLSVYVSDPSSRNLSVEFYWSNGTFLEQVDNVSSGDRAKISVSGLKYGKEYSWFVKVNNGKKVRVSDTWSFVTMTDDTDPLADPGEDMTVFVGETVELSASGSMDNTYITNYSWTFNNKTKFGENVEVVFQTAGTYVVELKVIDGFNNSDIGTLNVTVELKPDMDSDGMPNDWERRFGLDPRDPSDAKEDKDGDGYTNLEEYKHGTDPTDEKSHPMYKQVRRAIYFFISFGVSLSLILGLLLYSREGEKEYREGLNRESLYPGYSFKKDEPIEERYQSYMLEDKDKKS